MSEDVRQQIEEIVNRETRAWGTQDVELRMTVFHHDMVWPWPRTPQSHNPMDWAIPWGRYNYERWKSGWQELFDPHRLARNQREIKKIEISKVEMTALMPRSGYAFQPNVAAWRLRWVWAH